MVHSRHVVHSGSFVLQSFSASLHRGMNVRWRTLAMKHDVDELQIELQNDTTTVMSAVQCETE